MHNSVTMRMANVAKLKQFMITRTGLYFTVNTSNMSPKNQKLTIIICIEFVCLFFLQQIMKLRNIEGTLNFDSDKGTLDIHAIPRDKDCENAVSKTTNLSGGERSYTTVAFLISLWSCVDHPFYFLDEYDVFTVRIDRKITTPKRTITFRNYKTNDLF